jgi:hypothetical protein
MQELAGFRVDVEAVGYRRSVKGERQVWGDGDDW